MNDSDFNSRGFALGGVVQRVKDWLDWIHPEAWNIEHNRLHHYRLNEEHDPDLVQRNLMWLRDSDMSMAKKYAIVGLFMPTWKWAYYAPNTFKELQLSQMKKEGKTLPSGFNPTEAIGLSTMWADTEKDKIARQIVPPMDLFTKVLGPFFLLRFVALPAVFLAVPGVGPTLFVHAVVNIVLAELLTNVHAFATIVTNHAGKSMIYINDLLRLDFYTCLCLLLNSHALLSCSS
jgi:hypothetical protein